MLFTLRQPTSSSLLRSHSGAGLFKAKQAPAERPAFTHGPAPLAQVLKDIGFAASLGEARRMAAQGGVQLDGAKVGDANRVLEAGSYVVKYGKLKFADVRIEDGEK